MQNAKELFNIIRRKREEIFNLPIGDINENNSYQVLIFCKDIYADACAQYGQIQITPYKNLGYESEIKYINNFFKHCQTNININLNEKDILESHFRPSAIIHIPNVIANNIQRAEEISLNKASILINIFSLLKKSHGSFFAIFINHKNNGKHYFKFLDGEYRENLIPGTISGENGEIIRQYNQVLSESPSEMNVFIQLLNDYIKENNIMMKYYRLWEIIEGFARKQNICNKLVKDWNGNIFRNKNFKDAYLSGYSFCEYENDEIKYINTFYFIDAEKINRFKYFIKESSNKRAYIICNVELENKLRKELPSAYYCVVDLNKFIDKETRIYE